MQTSQSAGQDGAKSVQAKEDQGLPDAYRHRFFDKPENWSDKVLSSRINKNPIVDLCLRLSTFRVGPNSNGCFDPKLGKDNVRGPRRLYQMIGRFLERGTYNRMVCSSERQWKFVEECWIANMHTVLLNQCFDPVKLDRKLFRSIQIYKLWFIKFFFAGKRRTVLKKNGKKKVVFSPLNFERGLKGLKAISGWLQWAALSDMKEHNAPPPPIPYWDGWHSESQNLELKWFAGSLSRYRSILTDLKFTDAELTNLCQIRTFGRALPCPTKNMCSEAFRDQMAILTTEKITPPERLKVVSHFSNELGKRLNVREMPLHTHVSVSTSGCFERSQEEGGLAGEVSSWINQLDVPLDQVKVGPRHLGGAFTDTLLDLFESCGPIIDILDVYGEALFPRPKSFYGLSVGLKGLGLKRKNLSLLDTLYGGAGLSSKKRKASKFLDEEALPSSLGKVILLLSSVLAEDQGVFLSDLTGKPLYPEVYLHVANWKIPVYRGGQMRHHLIYKPIDMPMSKLDCLAEPGAKTRPLGKNQAWFTMVTRAMRFMAEPILSRDGRARIGLRSTNKMWTFLKYLKRVAPKYATLICQSTDYRSATDLIPLDILQALWTGFLRSLPKRHPFWVFGSLIVCQRQMFKASKFSCLEEEFPDGTLNLRGSFMGEPMSFLSLTLENLLVEEISSHYYYNVESRIWDFPIKRDLLRGDPICVCGDDVAALRDDLRRIFLFRKIAIDMGWEFSWKEGISCRILIFCEDHALVTRDDKGTSILYVDVIKSRLLTTMSREHSDNRSSILGKGRMLSNQLDYFENKNLKIAVLGYFRNIFDRCFSYGIIRNQACKMPIYLPPCAGGMGLPIVDSLMPSFMWPYIGHVFEVLDLKSESERFVKLAELSSLNSRIKHGFSSDVNPILKSIFKTYSKAIPGKREVSSTSIYDDSFVITLLQEVYQVELPDDPYVHTYDFSSLRNEASRIGFVPLTSLTEEVERVMNFQKFIKHGSKREPRTFNTWLSSSKRYWKFLSDPSESSRLSRIGKNRWKSVAALEKSITRGFSGWIYVGEDVEQMTLINSGPSLKISFSRDSRLGGKLRLYNQPFRDD